MSEKNDGGPAFARAGFEKSDERSSNYDGYPQEGLSVRDYFAAHVIAGLVANSNSAVITATGNEAAKRGEKTTMETYAREAYEYADAMLKERDRQRRK